MKSLVGILLCFISIAAFSFLYPVKRNVKTDVDITKFRYCTQDCYTHGLNQTDAHRCPHLCRH